MWKFQFFSFKLYIIVQWRKSAMFPLQKILVPYKEKNSFLQNNQVSELRKRKQLALYYWQFF